MNITIKIFAAGATTPRFVGALSLQATQTWNDRPALAEDLTLDDLRLLWDVEHAINAHVAGRCHIEVTE